MKTTDIPSAVDYAALAEKIKNFGLKLGFSAVGITGAELPDTVAGRLFQWLEGGCHDQMDYMAKRADFRSYPKKLFPELRSVISARLPYWPATAVSGEWVLAHAGLAYVSRYALGRDYHRVVRRRLRALADEMRREIGAVSPEIPFAYRAFSDSAPVMEVEFARLSGIAWRGRHSLSLSREGSWHFLGELYTSLPLPADRPAENLCGRCRRCVDACPTRAIDDSGQVDARLCISCLTIESDGPIPVGLRRLIGNRIYGCDDCQLCCPWNRFAKSGDSSFTARGALDGAALVELFSWDAYEFENRLLGSPIRRIGHERWLRNIAVALGNAGDVPGVRAVLRTRLNDPSALVREHVRWALGMA
ncbi:MAG: tRNA epoxyqueuosine(34) reductase QueG [Candidatus Accumulibacter sp.]|jgi:epoxyqueuosine reductase|nr:tRNA epoxyqueuosine(34) reductase QueG [Accumulibacter sp.]